MADEDDTPREVAGGKPCPVCGKPAQDKLRPFCSKRCADVDLHRWLSGRYAIPAERREDDEGDGKAPGNDNEPE